MYAHLAIKFLPVLPALFLISPDGKESCAVDSNASRLAYRLAIPCMTRTLANPRARQSLK
jgi:hypothetical protein